MDKKEKTRTSRNAAKTVSIADFHKMLVLSKWALGIFNGASFEPISQALKAPGLEGLDEESGHTRFYNALVGTNLFYLGDGAKCTKDELAAYDLRIVKYWKRITAKRNQKEGSVYNLKYYQESPRGLAQWKVCGVCPSILGSGPNHFS